MIKEYKEIRIRKCLQYLREENINEVQNFVGDDLKYNSESNEYKIADETGEVFLKYGEWIVHYPFYNRFEVYTDKVFREIFEEIEDRNDNNYKFSYTVSAKWND
jgi:hypothetical protein